MLTDVTIQKANPGISKRTGEKIRKEMPAGKITGLYLVVQPSGAKSWALRYRVAGRPKKLTLGSYPAVDLAAARKRAQEATGEVARGNDPAGAKKAAREASKADEAPSDRVKTIAESFIKLQLERRKGVKDKKLSESWANEAKRIIEREVIPALGAKRLSALAKADIHKMLDDIVKRGSPITANRVLAVFRRLCNWAVGRGHAAVSPCESIESPSAEESRDRVLEDDEIQVAWAAFDGAGWPFGPIAKLLLLTGARRDEIAGGRWSEIDLAANRWTIAKERSKNGLAHEIPLSESAVKILSALPRMSGKSDAFVFSTTGNTAVSGFSKAKASIDEAMFTTLKKTAEERGEDPEEVKAPPHWTLHDLRRTAASGMAGIGFPPHVVEAVLNHKSGTIKGVAKVYNRYTYAAEKRQALDAWARRLEAIASGAPTTNVVELAKVRG
jgi:integrase